RTRARRGVNNAPAWEIGGKVAPRRLVPREALHLHPRRLGLILPRSRRELLELQFQLIDHSLTALGARPEHLTLQLGDHQLQGLDQGLRAGELGPCLDHSPPHPTPPAGELPPSPPPHSPHS